MCRQDDVVIRWLFELCSKPGALANPIRRQALFGKKFRAKKYLLLLPRFSSTILIAQRTGSDPARMTLRFAMLPWDRLARAEKKTVLYNPKTADRTPSINPTVNTYEE
jgi:hypothetical protein